jgi:hypothetical protein
MAEIKSVKVGKQHELRLVEGRKTLHAVTYWPEQRASVDAAYDLIHAEANRLGVTIE